MVSTSTWEPKLGKIVFDNIRTKRRYNFVFNSSAHERGLIEVDTDNEDSPAGCRRYRVEHEVDATADCGCAGVRYKTQT